MTITTSKKLEQQVRESGTLIERLQECRERIGKMCKEGRPPKMTIPVQWYDDDFFIGVTLQDAIAAQPMPAPDAVESALKCTTDRLCPVHNVWHAKAPRR